MCSPTTESPMSSVAGTITGGPMSLRDGFDETRIMADTDLVSVAAGSVGNMALLGSSREVDEDDDEDIDDEEDYEFAKRAINEPAKVSHKHV